MLIADHRLSARLAAGVAAAALVVLAAGPASYGAGIPSRGGTAGLLKATAQGRYDVWAQVSTSGPSACAVRLDGSLWCWGGNSHGELGLGDRKKRTVPSRVGDENSWTHVDFGGDDACALKADRSLWCWGYNTNGQLGQGDHVDRDAPVQVGSSTDWASISLGVLYACATKTDGTLWCWGSNYAGALGFPGGDVSVPTQVGTDTNWSQVDGGDYATCATRTDHSLWCWGYNNSGQLGLGDKVNRSAPTQVGSDSDWRQVSAGRQFETCATRLDGSLWCWGANQDGGLGLGDTQERDVPTQVGVDTNWVGVSSNGGHACATTTSSTVWCWGRNKNGEVGVGDQAKHLTPQQVAGGAVWTAVSAGFATTCGLQNDHTLWCWGSPAQGGLGVGNRTQDHTVPIQVGPPNRHIPFSPALNGVSALASDDAWAVGVTTRRGTTHTLTEHWDGSAWTVVDSPSPGGSHFSELTSVTAIAPDDVWAVGSYNKTGSNTFHFKTLVLHWDGVSWTQVSSPNGAGAFSTLLTSVSATSADDVWTVGYFFYDEELGAHTVALHWDGATWTRVATPSPHDDDYLYAVAAVSPTNAWAAGANGLVAHNNGSGWTATHADLGDAQAMSASSRANIWAVGSDSMTYRFDGAHWTHVTSPDIGDLTGVSTVGPVNAVAVGGANAELWDGSTWQQVETAGVGTLNAVSLDSAADGWAVGSDGKDALLEHWDGSGFSRYVG